jgi:hypothetical protein
MRLETSSENTVLTFSATTANQPCGLFGVPRCHQVHCWARVVRWVVGAVCHLNILEMECIWRIGLAKHLRRIGKAGASSTLMA